MIIKGKNGKGWENGRYVINKDTNISKTIHTNRYRFYYNLPNDNNFNFSDCIIEYDYEEFDVINAEEYICVIASYNDYDLEKIKEKINIVLIDKYYKKFDVHDRESIYTGCGPKAYVENIAYAMSIYNSKGYDIELNGFWEEEIFKEYIKNKGENK